VKAVRNSLLVLLGLLLASPALAFDEPDGLQMLKFGQDVRAALPKCGDLTPEEKVQKPCWRQHDVWVADESKLTVQNVKVEEIALRINVEQIDERLERIEARFSGARFDELLAAMTTRFGKPTKSAATTYQNAFGATSRHPVHSWIGKRVTVTLFQMPLDRRETTGMLDYRTGKYLAKEIKEKGKKSSATAKDL
jgi:hypothetical protein